MRIFGNIVAVFAMAAGASSAAISQEKVTFATATGSVAYITYYAAEEMGFFSKVGIKPEMILTGSAPKAIAGLMSGDIDVVMPAPNQVIKARHRGLPIVLFGAVLTELNTNVVFSKDWAAKHSITDDSSIPDKIAALKGIRLAINAPGSITDSIARYFASRGGLDPDRDMTLVGIPNQSNAMMLAMEQGRVDGFVIAPPDTTIAAHKLGAIVAFNMSAGKVPDLAGYFHIGLGATEKFVRTEKAIKVAQAFQMTLDAIKDPKTTNFVRDKVRNAYYANVEPEIFADVWKDIVVSVPANLAMDDKLFDKVVALEKVTSPEVDTSMIAGSYTNLVADKVKR